MCVILPVTVLYLLLYVCYPSVAPYNVVIMGDNTYDSGDRLELNCSSEGEPDLEYSWSRTNTFSATTTTNTSTLTINDLATVDEGEYTCAVSNDAGSSNATVIVYSELKLIGYIIQVSSSASLHYHNPIH